MSMLPIMQREVLYYPLSVGYLDQTGNKLFDPILAVDSSFPCLQILLLHRSDIPSNLTLQEVCPASLVLTYGNSLHL
jgi:hypothetical protein